MEARTKRICNMNVTELFRLTDDENDRTLYPQIWYRTGFFLMQDGKKKIECYQLNGEKNIDFFPATRRVFPLDKAETQAIWKALAEAAGA